MTILWPDKESFSVRLGKRSQRLSGREGKETSCRQRKSEKDRTAAEEKDATDLLRI